MSDTLALGWKKAAKKYRAKSWEIATALARLGWNNAVLRLDYNKATAERDALALQLKAAQDALAAVIAENTAKADALEKLRRSHLIVEDDAWYSCPLAVYEDGSSAYSGGDSGCNCGADRANAIIDAALHPEPPDA